ncbi:MAG: large conductance mechanosensitive channel protein MscL [Actinomycetota bacterium]
MIKGFREFILRGNVIDLAVAVVIGTAFTGIVNAIVNSVFNPLIGALFNATSLAKALPVSIPAIAGGTAATLYFGAVIAAGIQFLLVAVVVYFALVVPINYIKRVSFRRKQEQPAAAEDAPPTELELLAEIRDLLARDTAATAHPAKHAE